MAREASDGSDGPSAGDRKIRPPGEASRQRIVNAARDLFAERGVVTTSMAEVADRAQVSKGLAYHYFDGKEAILQEIVEARWDEIHDAYAVIDRIEEPQRRLAAMIDEALERLAADAARERLYTALFLDPAMRPVLASAKENRLDAVEEVHRTVRRLMEEIQPSRPEAYALLFTAMLHGLTILSAVSLDGEMRELREVISDLFASEAP